MRRRKRQPRFTHALTSRRIPCEFEGCSQPPRHVVNAQRRACRDSGVMRDRRARATAS